MTVRVVGDQAHLVPVGEENIAVKAARLLAATAGADLPLGASLVIRKAIPVTGGMAGGSADAAGALLTQARASAADVSGVNLDEEATNLIKYQQAYQAAGKVMQIAGTIFDTLLSIGR